MDVNIRLKAFHQNVFKSYDVRGLYPEELDQNTIEILSEALSTYFNDIPGSEPCLIGYDVRWSSREIFEMVKNILLKNGINLIDLGLATTPLFAFSVSKSAAKGGIMITASHNSIQYNGLKIYRGIYSLNDKNGFPEIKKIIEDGNINDYKGPKGSITKKSFANDYISFLISRTKIERNIKAVFDTGGGAVGFILKDVLRGLDKIKAVSLNFDPDPSLVVRDPNPLLERSHEKSKKEISENKCEVGFIFDPDGDRVVVLDEKGTVVRSDALLWLLTKRFVHSGETVVHDVRFSKAFGKDLKSEGINCQKSRVGHSFFKEVMRNNDAVLGGELSGHYYFKEFFYSESAILTALKILSILASSKEKLSELLRPYLRYFHSGEINFTFKNRESVMNFLEEKYSDASRDYFDGIIFHYKNWWFNVRFSNTENVLRLVLEAEDEKTFNEKKDELFNLFSSKGLMKV